MGIGAQADLRVQDNYGADPLLSAVGQGRGAEFIAFLLDSKASMDAKDWFERSALHLAAKRKDVNSSAVVALLLERRGDVSEKDSLERSPVDYATNEAVQKLLAA